MTYNKPDDITYTQMAIWIDEHVYSDNCDDEVLYRYLYYLSEMLARQSDYFRTAHDYDQYSLYCASTLFMRLRNEKQFEQDESGNFKMEKIKSILNYLKTVSYPYKIDYERKIKNSDEMSDEVISLSSANVNNLITEVISYYDDCSFQYVSNNIISAVRQHLSKIPHKKHSTEWNNIYLSCLLTLLSSISPTKKQLLRIDNTKSRRNLTVERVYTELRYSEPVLFHLPQSMSNYITILVNQIRHVIAADISWTSDYDVSASSSMKSMIYDSIEESYEYKE